MRFTKNFRSFLFICLLYIDFIFNAERNIIIKKTNIFGGKCFKLNTSGMLGFDKEDSVYKVHKLTADNRPIPDSFQPALAPGFSILVRIRPQCRQEGEKGRLFCPNLNHCNFGIEGYGLIPDMENIKIDSEGYYSIKVTVNPNVHSNENKDGTGTTETSSGIKAMKIYVLGTFQTLQYKDFNYRFAGKVMISSVFSCKRAKSSVGEISPILGVSDELSCKLTCRGYGPESGIRGVSSVECLPEQFKKPRLFFKTGDQAGEEAPLGTEEFGHVTEFYSDSSKSARSNYLFARYTPGNYRKGGKFCLRVELAQVREGSPKSPEPVSNIKRNCFELEKIESNYWVYFVAVILVFSVIIFVMKS